MQITLSMRDDKLLRHSASLYMVKTIIWSRQILVLKKKLSPRLYFKMTGISKFNLPINYSLFTPGIYETVCSHVRIVSAFYIIILWNIWIHYKSHVWWCQTSIILVWEDFFYLTQSFFSEILVSKCHHWQLPKRYGDITLKLHITSNKATYRNDLSGRKISYHPAININ